MIARNGRHTRRDDEDPPVRTVRFEIAPRSIFLILAVIAGILLLARLWQIILMLIVALVLAGTFSPVVTWLERHRVPRPLALGLILIALLGCIVGLGALDHPRVRPPVRHPRHRRAPDSSTPGGPRRARATPRRPGGRHPCGTSPVASSRRSARMRSTSAGAAAQLVVLGGTTIVIAFYLIADHERVQGFLFALLPRRYHVRTARVLLDMERVVGGYMRGQAITSLCIGVFVFLLLQVTGVPAALPLAILAAFADLIPLVGGVLAVAPSVLFALTIGPLQAVIVLVALVIYQQFENHLLLPRVYGQSLHISPLAVIVALLVGGTLLGVVGALLALPMAAGIHVLIENYRIGLPGDQPGDKEERAEAAQAEATYAAQPQGTSAMESAMRATEIAEQLQEAAAAKGGTGQVAVPVEERRDPPRQTPDMPNRAG